MLSLKTFGCALCDIEGNGVKYKINRSYAGMSIPMHHNNQSTVYSKMSRY